MSLFKLLMSLVDPVLLFDSAVYDFTSAATNVVGTKWKNRLVATPPSANQIWNSSGQFANEGTFTGTGAAIDYHFADGPTHTGTAAKITLPAITVNSVNNMWKPVRDRNCQNVVCRFKVKTAVPGVNQLIRTHMNNPAGPNFTATDTWQTVTLGPLTDTTGYFGLSAQLDGVTKSILVDELQLYTNGVTPPAYADDGNDGHAARPYANISKSGNLVTNSPMAILSPQYPIAKNWSSMTVMAAFAVTSDVLQTLFSSINDTDFGTTQTHAYFTVDNGEVVYGPGAVVGTGKLTGQDYVIVGWMWNAASTQSYINEVKLNDGSGRAAFNAESFTMLARAVNAVPNQVFTGGLAFMTIWDRKLTALEWSYAVRQGRQRLSALGAPFRNRDWYIAEGDSITASFTPVMSFAYQMSTSVFTGSKYIQHLNLAVGGNPFATIEGRLSDLLNRIAEAKRGGGVVVVSLMTGTNDRLTLISTPAVNAFWVRLQNYYTAVRNAGAYMIAITCLPMGPDTPTGGPSGTWETYRNQLNTLIRSNPSAYDALADMGDTSTTMGNVTNANNTTYYNADDVHPTQTGQNLLRDIIKPVIQTFIP